MKNLKENKKIKENNISGSIFVITVLVLCSFLLSLYGVYIFMIGFHNIDLGYNSRMFEIAQNTSLIDVGSDYVERTPTRLYMLGLSQIKSGAYFLLCGALLFGYFLCGHIMLVADNLKRKNEKIRKNNKEK